jgi:uncharacterized protein with HEPN domain
MSRSDAHRVADMIMAADEIADIVRRGRAAFDDDRTLRRALERCLEILGEAAKSVSPELRAAHQSVPWSDLAKVRDRLSHHYHRIDPAQLWVIAERDVPAATERIRKLEGS